MVTVVLADDHAVVAESLDEILEQLGAQSVAALVQHAIRMKLVII